MRKHSNSSNLSFYLCSTKHEMEILRCLLFWGWWIRWSMNLFYMVFQKWVLQKPFVSFTAIKFLFFLPWFWWIFKWVVKFPLNLKVLPHMLHLCFLMSEWMLILCLLKFEVWVNALSHWLHLNFLILEWTFLCLFNRVFDVKSSLQKSQTK